MTIDQLRDRLLIRQQIYRFEAFRRDYVKSCNFEESDKTLAQRYGLQIALAVLVTGNPAALSTDYRGWSAPLNPELVNHAILDCGRRICELA